MDFSIKLNGVNNTTATTNAQQVSQEETGLFETESTKETNNNSKLDALEAELARLEAEQKALNEQKAQKEAEKKQLEAQKRALETRKQQIQAEILANNEKIQQEIAQMEANQKEFQAQEQELAELEAQYVAKTDEASKISEQLNEKIDEILAKAEEEMNIQKDEMKSAMDEAQAKVESGEIEESEVEAYVAKKLGVAAFSSNTSQMFSVVNALNNQLKSTIQASSSLLAQIKSTQINLTNFSTQMAQTNANINNLIAANSAKSSELSSVNSDITLVDAEIAILDGDISSLDTNIAQKNQEIQQVKWQISAAKNPEAVQSTITLGNKMNFVRANVSGLSVAKNEYTSAIVNNPFVSLSFVATDYSNMVAALDAMSVTAENRENLVRDFIKENNEENRRAVK